MLLLAVSHGRVSHVGGYPSYATLADWHRCDILCLYSLGVAMNGGETLFAPSAAVYNEIAATRPDVIGTLADPTWIYNKFVFPEQPTSVV